MSSCLALPPPAPAGGGSRRGFSRSLYGSSSAPMSLLSPLGRVSPSKSCDSAPPPTSCPSSTAGEPVWINFWASWCGPCRRELPDIQRVAAEFEDDGLGVLEVNVGESRDTARGFFEEVDVDLPILLDSNNEVSEQYRLSGMPSNFFIDEDGIVRDVPIGFLTEEQMREKLAVLGLG